MKHCIRICILICALLRATVLFAAQESEPNNTYAQSNLLAQDTVMNGTLLSSSDNDYYISVPVREGTMKVYFSYSGGSNGADLYMYAYNKSQATIGTKAILNLAAGSDSLLIYCRQADTIYFRVDGSEPVPYQFHYTMVETGVGGVEPNNTFAQALFMQPADTARGRIGYSSVAIDAYDYYYTVLPVAGTLRLILDQTNTSNSPGADLWLDVYNKAQATIGTLSKVNQPVGINPADTLDIFCRQADTVYFRLQANECFSYSLRYEMIPSGVPDPEPNNSFAQAGFFQHTDTAKGRVGYTSTNANTDANDYFYTVLPDDGTLRVYLDIINTSNSAGADLWLYAYNRAQAQIGVLSKVNQALGVIPTDTLDIFCRQADTVYFRINANECFSYRLRYEVIPSGTRDTEPNNTVAGASYFPQTDTVKGRVGYYTNVIDANDYFYSVLPDDGTLRIYLDLNNTSHDIGADFWLYAYNKAQGTIGTLSKTNQPLGVRPQDTLDIFCRAADTVFFRANANECFSYAFRYEVIPSGTGDAEPNNTLATAAPIALKDTLRGRIGHTSTVQDANDYFRFTLPQRSRITAYVSHINTSNSTGADLYMYFQNKAGANLVSRSFINQALGVHYDTIVFTCAPADTLLLRVNANECFSYQIRFEVKNEQPDATIIAARTGNEFGFVAQTEHADWIEWDFGNGKKSNFKYPAQTYGIGTYTVRLTARNTGCNLTDADSMLVEVKGIERYQPQRAGAGGDLLLTVYGGGLDSATSVKLIRNSGTLIPFLTRGNSKRNALSASFDLHFAQPGLYDVEITIPGQPPVLYPNGFRVDSFRYPFCKAEVIGPARWRINQQTPFEIKVSNSGNVNANGVIVGFAYPKSVQVTFLPKQIKLDRNAVTSVAVDGETFTLSNAVTAPYADSASKPTPIDSLFGRPFDGYFIYLTLPKVPYNSSISIPFKTNTTAVGGPSFHVFTHHPNLFGSCTTPHWSNVTNMWVSETIDAVDMAADKAEAPGLFKGLIKAVKIGQKHLAYAGASAGAHFDAWYNDYEVTGEMYGNLNAELDEANAFALQTATDELGSYVFEKGMGKVLENNKVKNEWWNKTMANNENLSPESFDHFLDKINGLEKGSQRLMKLQSMLKGVKDLKTLNDKINTLQQLVKDCPELEPQLADLLQLLDEELDPKDPNDKPTQSVVSMDPNAIYGPEGVGGPRYRKDLETVHYMVTCENVDTASAAAQVVRIVDTLDPNLFDLSTFEFGNVYIGKKAARLLSGRDAFFGEVSLYPEVPLMARIIARLDRSTGIITWDMAGIDTATGLLPIDPDLGLLPPNTASPLGEAVVNYSVRLKAGLPSGTEIKNTAHIYFDQNEPIATNTWVNKLDIVRPVSRVRSATLLRDSVIRLRFSGSDAESGIARYRVYMQRDTGGWQRLGVTAADTMTLIGEAGKTYRFYAAALDRVGNAEQKSAQSEGEVTVPSRDVPRGSGIYAVYPNPSTGDIQVRTATDLAGVQLRILDFTGRKVMKGALDFTAGQAQTIDLKVLSNGYYLMVFTGPGGQKETHKILVLQPGR